jgi:hypothetical protein
MHFLPQGDEFFEVVCRGVQDSADIAPLGISRPHRITPVCQDHSAIGLEVDNRFRIGDKSMHVTGSVVLRIRYEKHIPKAARCHSNILT